MTSPATSDLHLLKFGKRPKMPLPAGFGRILVALRFACPTNWWVSCLLLLWKVCTDLKINTFIVHTDSKLLCLPLIWTMLCHAWRVVCNGDFCFSVCRSAHSSHQLSIWNICIFSECSNILLHIKWGHLAIVIRPLNDRTYCVQPAFTHFELSWKLYICSRLRIPKMSRRTCSIYIFIDLVPCDCFLSLDEAIASRAVFVIVAGSDGRKGTLLEPAK